MSEVNTSDVKTELKSSDQVDVNTSQEVQPSINDVLAELESLKQTNARLLEESKSNKQKYVSLRDQQDNAVKEELLKKQQYKEYAERVEQERDEVITQLAQVKKTAVESRYQADVLSMASDADPQYVSILLGQIKPTAEEIASGEYDKKEIAMRLDSLRTSYPKLFQTAVPQTNNSKPKYVNEAPKSIKEMTLEELKEHTRKKYR